MSSDVMAVRYFRTNDAGFVVVERKQDGNYWTRVHPNGMVTRSHRPFQYVSEAATVAGADSDAEFYPSEEDRTSNLMRALADTQKVSDTTEQTRPGDLVHRLRRLERGEISAEARLLRELREAISPEDLDRLPLRTRQRILELVDRTHIIRLLEELPIEWDGDTKWAQYFVLIDGKWFPASHGNERTVGQHRWLDASLPSPNGSSSVYPCRWPEWAYADMDGQPCL